MKKTKRFVVMLLVLCLTVSCLPVGAFDFEMPETAGEMPETNLVSSALNAAIDIPTEDETLGTLVWYNNFDETDAATATYSAGAYTAGAYQEGGVDKSTLEIADNPDTEKTGKALKITQTAAHGGYQVTFTDKLSTPGVYTLLVDIYVPEDGMSTASGFWTHFEADRYNGTTIDPNEWHGGDYVKGTGAWYTYQETFSLPGNNLTEESLKAYKRYILHKSTSDHVYYIDNVRIYCNAYKSAARPAAYDKTYGQLVYFENFAPNNDFENLTNIKIAPTMPAPSACAGYYAVGSGDVGDRVRTYGFEVGYADGDNSFRFLDESRSLLSGKVTFYAEIYSKDSDKDYFSVVSERTSNAGNWSAWGGGVITPWDGKTAKANTYTKLYFESFDLLSTDTRFGTFNSANQSGAYARAIGVYFLPDNELWLTSDAAGSDRVLVKIDNDTYTLPSEIAGKTVFDWTDGSKVWVAGESAAKADVAGKTLYPISVQTAPASYDATYGQLIYFDNFSGKTGFTNLADIKLANYADANKKHFDGFTTLQCGQSKFDPKTVGIEVTPADETNWKYADGTPMTGDISLYVELYVDNDTLPDRFTVGAPGSVWGGYFTNWGVGKNTLTAKTWGMVQSKPLSLADYTDIGILSNKWYPEYCRAIGVYLRPDNAFWLTSDESGANRTFTVIPGETYTLPTEFSGKAVSKWLVGANVYDAGKPVEKAALAGKTAYPFESPATYDETYGQLIFYSGFHFSDAPFANEIEELSPVKGLTVMQNTYNGISVVGGRTAFSAKGGAFGNGGYAGIGIQSSDGQLWKYEDGTVVTGRVVAFTDYYYDIAESEDFNIKESLFVRYTPSDDSIYSLSEAIKSTWLTTKTPESYMAAGDFGAYERFYRKTGLTSFTIGRQGAADKLHFDNIKVYVKPDNALWLVDAEGGNRTFNVVSTENYTFPATFNGVNVRAWKNGDKTYNAGQAVALADVAGKTWTVSATTDVAFADAVSVRTSGTPGIRFKATLDLATRADENFAEIGFMATRDKHYTNAFNASADSFILANANAANAKLCAVVRKSGSDLNRYLTEGNGELNFNAIVVNVPENAAYLKENLYLRAFVVCGGVTYYSAVKTDSVYDAVKRVSADPNYENDPYIRRIIELCETTNG
ncbi:MAG: hypothetical protein ACOYIO_00310 [Eubacteriales bacterium]|jgi:hypothetical protein